MAGARALAVGASAGFGAVGEGVAPCPQADSRATPPRATPPISNLRRLTVLTRRESFVTLYSLLDSRLDLSTGFRQGPSSLLSRIGAQAERQLRVEDYRTESASNYAGWPVLVVGKAPPSMPRRLGTTGLQTGAVTE